MLMTIKAHREAAELSQVELANMMGVMQSAVANWESEVALPRTRQLPQLAQIFGCSINDLFNDQPQPAQ